MPICRRKDGKGFNQPQRETNASIRYDKRLSRTDFITR